MSSSTATGLRLQLCVIGETFSAPFLLAWTELMWALGQKGVVPHVRVSQATGTWQSVLGYDAESQGQLFEGQSYDVALLLGPGALPTAASVLRLLDSPHDVTAAPCAHGASLLAVEERGQGPMTAERWHDVLQDVRSGRRDAYLPVHTAGLACLALKAGVLERLQPPAIFTAPPCASPATSLCRNLHRAGAAVVLDCLAPVPFAVPFYHLPDGHGHGAAEGASG